MIWLWVGLAALVLALGALIPVLAARRHQLRGNDEAVAARSRQAMLAHYVEDRAAGSDV